ncbi:hypothetical protein WOLCODRAFT_153131 [Wolfiporia cocos MD-104 SS10]|uniref:Uncharacterized protein n=1 Tax=Wolfiporia cocos (strain MD-104) TaxID=742152 RepID=A0A2H3K208_WOLCO|nr:hypothetical protein WOLCODRAFT_153131 [Wolfiporia cocos MD-104 SS10]
MDTLRWNDTTINLKSGATRPTKPLTTSRVPPDRLGTHLGPTVQRRYVDHDSLRSLTSAPSDWLGGPYGSEEGSELRWAGRLTGKIPAYMEGFQRTTEGFQRTVRGTNLWCDGTKSRE